MSRFQEASRPVILIGNFLACLAMSLGGLWFFVFIPSAFLALALKSKWINLAEFGITGALGALVSMVVIQPSYRLEVASLVASIIGLPGGFLIPLVLTLVIVFLVSGLGGMVGSSVFSKGEK
jgi:uncharacterized membrane protein YjjB (DUF3815 family)